MKHYKKGLHSLSLVEAHKSCNSHDKLFDEFNRSQFFHYVCRCGQSKILLCCLNPFPSKTYFCTKTHHLMGNTDLGSVHGRQRGAPKSSKIFEYLNVMGDGKVEEDV